MRRQRRISARSADVSLNYSIFSGNLVANVAVNVPTVSFQFFTQFFRVIRFLYILEIVKIVLCCILYKDLCISICDVMEIKRSRCFLNLNFKKNKYLYEFHFHFQFFLESKSILRNYLLFLSSIHTFYYILSLFLNFIP